MKKLRFLMSHRPNKHVARVTHACTRVLRARATPFDSKADFSVKVNPSAWGYHDLQLFVVAKLPTKPRKEVTYMKKNILSLLALLATLAALVPAAGAARTVTPIGGTIVVPPGCTPPFVLCVTPPSPPSPA